MNTTIPSDLTHIVILDISGIYVQIHNQGYFDIQTVEEIKQQYGDVKRWYVLVIDE